jgi:penicillin amidase
VRSDDPFEKVAVGLLRRWDYRMEPESSAALVFQVAWMHLLDLLFGDKLGEATQSYLGISLAPIFIGHGFMLRASTRLLELVEAENDSVWYTDATTGKPRQRDELLHEALRRAVRQIRHDLGDNARRWNWGRMHQVRYVHPTGSARLFRRLFNRGPFPVGGDAMTVNLSGYAPQLTPGLVQVLPGYRQIITLGAWDDAHSVTATGQSGHPLSDHYDDQITMWREGVYHPMPWSRVAVESAAHYRMTLVPTPR